LPDFGQHARLDYIRQDLPLGAFNVHFQIINDFGTMADGLGLVDGGKRIHLPLCDVVASL
jgi:hypothetical protein